MVCHQELVIVGVKVVTTMVHSISDFVCLDHYIYQVEITQMQFTLSLGRRHGANDD